MKKQTLLQLPAYYQENDVIFHIFHRHINYEGVVICGESQTVLFLTEMNRNSTISCADSIITTDVRRFLISQM